MKKVNNYIKDSIKWIWQFPQNILALCIESVLCQISYNIYRGEKVEGNTIIFNDILPAGMSLGDYIFVNHLTSQRVIRHECGHSKQSDILGPLYIIIVGVPSLLHNIVHKICSKIGIKWNYYSFYTEKWADDLM